LQRRAETTSLIDFIDFLDLNSSTHSL
jgi:hypothetical protein